MATRVLGWIVIVAAIAAPAAYLYFYEEPLEVTAMTIGRGHVEETFSAISSGTVVANADAMVAAGYMGIIVARPVVEGEHVVAGQELVVLDHSELDAQVKLAESNVAAGESQLEQAKLAAEIYAEVSVAKVSLAQEQAKSAQQDYDRMARLSTQDVASQSNVEKTALALRVAQENLAAAKASQRENLVRQEEIQTARANVEQLTAALAVANAAREKAFIHAPFDGTVAKVLVDVGEAVTIGMPVVQLVNGGGIYVEAPFDEANASDIAIGQKARVNLDAYRDVDFAGEVTFISPIVALNPDLSRTLNVKIRVTENQDKFIPGMSADVTIVADEKDDAVFARSESIIRGEYAYVIEDGRAIRRRLETGVGNWHTREVLSGLSEGEQLITSVSLKELTEGVKVKVVDELDG